MDEWECCTSRVDVVMTDGGGPRRFLAVRTAEGCGDNADGPMSRKIKVRRGFSVHSRR